jgi:hypothetical protein
MAAKTAEQIAAEATANTISILKAAGLLGPDTSGNKNTTTSQKTAQKLTPESARALLEQTRTTIQSPAGITQEDVNDFIKKFDEEQNRQIEEVVRVAKTRVTTGAGEGAIASEIQNLLTTEYPSYFKPTEFATDYLWSKTNFGDEASLGAKALQALNDVRAVIRNFNANDISDIEAQDYARKIATGKMTADDLSVSVGQKYSDNYPQFADRLKSIPGATVRSLASPYINLMAKELELDPETINLDDPELDKALRPDGTAGKMPAMSLADFKMALRKSPKWEYTTAANEAARSSATGLARAFGFGV